jgi:hypothetical protein
MARDCQGRVSPGSLVPHGVNQKQTHSEALADKVPDSGQAQRLGVHVRASAQLSAHVSPSFMIKFGLEPKADATFRR